MPLDPVREADTRGWLAKARMDLRSAEVDLGASPPITGDAAFHCQQAVEKALKALLTWHDQPFRKTHDLVELGGQCAELQPPLEPLLRAAAPLTAFAWRFRYPGEPDEPPLSEAQAALSLARRLVGEIESAIPLEPAP
ncbi:MAG: HEPN domain-containing protein [Gemmatimonadetes bacterium]|nr:HEPN domain-containing protein [Gemmatimonadota bacterium]